MTDPGTFRKIFDSLKYAFGAVGGLLLVWMCLHLFIREVGGPFPQRTRGPLANPEYTKLSEFEPWENFLRMEGTGKTLSEMLIDGDAIPPLEFTKPDALPEQPADGEAKG